MAMGAAGGGPLGLLVSATILALIGVMAFSIRLFSVSFGSKLRTWCIYMYCFFAMATDCCIIVLAMSLSLGFLDLCIGSNV